MIKVTFEGYNEKKEKMQLVKIGNLEKETEKQIVIKEPLGASCTINKSILSIILFSRNILMLFSIAVSEIPIIIDKFTAVPK